MKQGIHYVKYRYRPTHKGVWPSDATMAKLHNKWRVYRNGRMIDPVYGVYYYETKASAEQAVKDMLLREVRLEKERREHDTMVAPPFKQPKQTTRCLNCGRVLTDEQGHRLESANFDSSLPCFPIYGGGLYQNVVWARCDSCYKVALSPSRTWRSDGPVGQ